MRFLATSVSPRAFTYNFLDEVEKIFNQESTTTNQPANLREEESRYVLTMDLPGVNRDDLKIDLQEDTLSMSGTRRSQGEFSRKFTLPTHIDAEKVEATYEDGVLEIILPKAESAKPRRIELRKK